MKIHTQFTYRDNMTCQTTSADGRGALTIAPASRPDASDATWSPMNLLALAHGTCLAMMMSKAAKAEGLDIAGTMVEMALEMDTTPPRIVGVQALFHVPHRFTRDQVARLKAGAEMCPIHRALRPEIPVELELVIPE